MVFIGMVQLTVLTANLGLHIAQSMYLDIQFEFRRFSLVSTLISNKPFVPQTDLKPFSLVSKPIGVNGCERCAVEYGYPRWLPLGLYTA